MTCDSKPLVIIVEDDMDAAFLLRRLLVKSGFVHDTLHLGDGEKALDFFKARRMREAVDSAPLVLILLDIKMPKVNGFEVLEHIKKQAQLGIPVIVMTTSDDPNDKQRAESLGADAFVSKFPSLDEFQALLRRLVQPKVAGPAGWLPQ